VTLEARCRVRTNGSRAIRYADANRTTTRLALAGLARALGWLARSSRSHGASQEILMIRKILTAFLPPGVIAFITRRVSGRSAAPQRRGS